MLQSAPDPTIAVTPGRHDAVMAISGVDKRGGVEVRHGISVALLDARSPLTLGELVAAVEALGIHVPERKSKTVSDALRWEIRKGRAMRLNRGLYRLGSMPRSTEWWVRAQVASHDRLSL